MIEFYKMSGSGNDFIIIDNMDLSLDVGDLSEFTRKVCQPKISVGADGLVVIEPSDIADFKWRFFNADGSMAEMCGNAARCVARFAYMKGIAGQTMSWETIAGIISAVVNDDVVKAKLTDPSPVESNIEIETDGLKFILDSIDTGVPHAVVFVDDLDTCEVYRQGRNIRTNAASKMKRWLAERVWWRQFWRQRKEILLNRPWTCWYEAVKACAFILKIKTACVVKFTLKAVSKWSIRECFWKKPINKLNEIYLSFRRKPESSII